jgi:hypothetical protein
VPIFMNVIRLPRYDGRIATVAGIRTTARRSDAERAHTTRVRLEIFCDCIACALRHSYGTHTHTQCSTYGEYGEGERVVVT